MWGSKPPRQEQVEDIIKKHSSIQSVFFQTVQCMGQPNKCILTSQLFFQANGRANEPNHWWKSSGLFRTESLFACLLTPSESWGPHTHGIRSTSNSNNALKHWTYEPYCLYWFNHQSAKKHASKSRSLRLHRPPFLSIPWSSSTKTTLAQKQENTGQPEIIEQLTKYQIRADHKSRISFPRHLVVKGVPFGTLHCKIPILFIAAK